MPGKSVIQALQPLRLSGSSTLALSTVVINGLRLVSTVVLTRILSPDVFGVVGLIMSVIYVINMVTDVGLQSYVVRHHRSDNLEFLNSVFTLHAVRGLVLALIGVAASWPISQFLGKQELAAPLAVSSLVFLIDGHISLHSYAYLRKGGVRRFAMLDLVRGVMQTLSAILLSLLLRNVWAIVISLLAGSGLRVWASHALFPGSGQSYRFERDVARDLWRFSRVVGLSSALTLLVNQLDKLALGKILTLAEFGTFIIAASLATAPIAFATSYASSIVSPAVAAAWRQGRSTSEPYYESWGRFWYFYGFATGGLIGGAQLVIRTLYDERYLPAAVYLSILAVGSSLAMVTRSMEATQVASGRQRAAVEFNLIRLVWLIGGAAIALYRSNPIVLVFAIGLIEIPVYAVGLLKMQRLGEVRWTREILLLLTIASGAILGHVIDTISLALFPGL